jgi:hypothetical protein
VVICSGKGIPKKIFIVLNKATLKANITIITNILMSIAIAIVIAIVISHQLTKRQILNGVV